MVEVRCRILDKIWKQGGCCCDRGGEVSGGDGIVLKLLELLQGDRFTGSTKGPHNQLPATVIMCQPLEVRSLVLPVLQQMLSLLFHTVSCFKQSISNPIGALKMVFSALQRTYASRKSLSA